MSKGFIQTWSLGTEHRGVALASSVQVLPKACILELAPIRPGQMSGEPCLSILRAYERKTRRRSPTRMHYMRCSHLVPARQKMFHDAHS
jgi:hypothetical protein